MRSETPKQANRERPKSVVAFNLKILVGEN